MNSCSKPLQMSAAGDSETASACLEKRVLKVCIAGSGAIGGTLAVRLAAEGHDVCVIARNEQLLAQSIAMNKNGGTLLACVTCVSFGLKEFAGS
jgi:pyruvate/2-oxoglutarate dehydrogenase complex dihydrolipoamide dehydrogenase (E3) component